MSDEERRGGELRKADDGTLVQRWPGLPGIVAGDSPLGSERGMRQLRRRRRKRRRREPLK